MGGEQGQASGGHLGYYEQHGISPVRYNVDNLEHHFDRRDSLYRSLGLPPMAFRGCQVLEIAPGSGQNSFYIACCEPARYDLVEPNSSGIRDIRAGFDGLGRSHTAPTLHPVRFEAFEASSRYDVVICENWLGGLPNELALIRKLSSLVAPGGVMVMTITPSSGLFPNIMRHLLAARLVDPAASFEERTARLVDVFAPHLTTIADMTRSVRDWVQDCLINPHYFNIVLPLEIVLKAIDQPMEVLATFPRFTLDWRWFKSLSGDSRRFNRMTLDAYRANTHNFIDYRKTWPARAAETNAGLDTCFTAIHQAALAWDVASNAADAAGMDALIGPIGARLGEIVAAMAEIGGDTARAIAELKSVWEHPRLDAALVRDMPAFGSLFGRETIYVSFTRPRETRLTKGRRLAKPVAPARPEAVVHS